MIYIAQILWLAVRQGQIYLVFFIPIITYEFKHKSKTQESEL